MISKQGESYLIEEHPSSFLITDKGELALSRTSKWREFNMPSCGHFCERGIDGHCCNCRNRKYNGCRVCTYRNAME